MELKVGMYVKTDGGIIDKVAIDYNGRCNSPYCNCKHISCEHDYYDEDNIVKSSENIIDLIEVGDYVNGYRVVDIILTYFNGLDRRKMPKRIGLKVTNGKFDYENYIEADEIKEIVTKEQFNSKKYEVKEDE